MLQIDKKKCFIELGRFLSQFSFENYTKNETVLHNDLYFDSFADLIQLSQSHNGWFTPEQVCFSVQSWANALTEENLNKWLSNYSFNETTPKTVGLILAGNIPLVGFHDFLSVLISGHNVLVKTSSNDQHLIKFLAKYLITVNPEIQNHITFTDGKLENFDA
ncbi:MAG TPA: acyl-CoA reductase, partial [Flavobacterium sp.]|nr:acyl-CoA reductase [Flavobacterium sp.]